MAYSARTKSRIPSAAATRPSAAMPITLRSSAPPAVTSGVSPELRPMLRGGLAGLRGRAARLELVRILVVGLRQPGPEERERPMLHLPDVAELVRDEVVADRIGRRADQDRPR